MKKWNMIVDIARCHDCNNCFLACKDEYVNNDFPGYSVSQPWHGQRWMNIFRKERGQYPIVQVAYMPLPCMHCDEAPCLTADGAVYKRDDGIVLIDPVKAAGRKEILESCPYGVMYWNEEKQVAQKCTGCAHLIDDGWTDTRCSQVCPTDAMKLVLADDAEMAQKVSADGLEVFRPELSSGPRVYYKNLHRWTKCFLAGNVVFGDTDECADQAKVVVEADGNAVGEDAANSYGDFVVDGLEPGKNYSLTITAVGYETATLESTPQFSVNLGHIILKRA